MLDICSKLISNDVMFKYYDQLNDLLLVVLLVELLVASRVESRVDNKCFKIHIIVNEVIITTKPIALLKII
jgi:hypothetical protein